MESKASPAQRDEEHGREAAAARGPEAAPHPKRAAFHNHPDDPNNPNEVREQFLKKIRSLRLS